VDAKIRTMSTTECEQLVAAGDPERMHEFALRWVLDSPLSRFLLLTRVASSAAAVMDIGTIRR
jgi:hypothetical protein